MIIPSKSFWITTGVQAQDNGLNLKRHATTCFKILVCYQRLWRVHNNTYSKSKKKNRGTEQSCYRGECYQTAHETQGYCRDAEFLRKSSGVLYHWCRTDRGSKAFLVATLICESSKSRPNAPWNASVWLLHVWFPIVKWLHAAGQKDEEREWHTSWMKGGNVIPQISLYKIK